MVFVARRWSGAADAAAADRRRDDQPAAHGGEDRARVQRPTCTCSTRRAPSTWSSSLLSDRSASGVRRRSRRSGRLREQYAQRARSRCCRTTQARANRPALDWDDARDRRALVPRRAYRSSVPLAELVPYIDWTFFFSAWELKGRFPAILDHPKYGGARASCTNTRRSCSIASSTRSA
jgi:hypothetical protein